jgi:hypothetical protein
MFLFLSFILLPTPCCSEYPSHCTGEETKACTAREEQGPPGILFSKASALGESTQLNREDWRRAKRTRTLCHPFIEKRTRTWFYSWEGGMCVDEVAFQDFPVLVP